MDFVVVAAGDQEGKTSKGARKHLKRAVSYILTIIWLACSPVFAEPEPESNINGIAPGMHIGKVFEEIPRLSREPIQTLLTSYYHAVLKVYITPEKDLTVVARDDLVTIVSGKSLSIEESEVLKLGENIVDAESILKPNSITEDSDFAYFRVGEKVIRLDLEMNKISWFSLWVEDQE